MQKTMLLLQDYRLLRKEFGAGSASRPDAVVRIETSEGNRPNAILKKRSTLKIDSQIYFFLKLQYRREN